MHWHCPETQVPVPQLSPHCPQLLGSDASKAQPIFPPQFTAPGAQVH
jgi:hypothetical protein